MISLDALSMPGHGGSGTITAQHDTRSFERANYNLKTIICHAIDSSTGYSAVSLQKVSLYGIFTCFFGFVVLIYVSIHPLLSDQSVQGLPSVVFSIAIFSGTNCLH